MLPKRHCKEKRSYGMLREIKWQYSSLGNELVWEIQIYSHRNFGLNWSKMISTILTSFSYFPIIYPFTYFLFFFCIYGLGTWLSLYVSLFYRYNQINKDCFFKEWASKCSNTYKGHKVLQCANKDQSNSKVNFAAWTLDSNSF